VSCAMVWPRSEVATAKENANVLSGFCIGIYCPIRAKDGQTHEHFGSRCFVRKKLVNSVNGDNFCSSYFGTDA